LGPYRAPNFGGVSSEEADVEAGLLIDLEEPATWPQPLSELTDHWAERLRRSTHFTSDLRLPIALEGDFEGTLANDRLLAFHATRLFDHEVQAIRGRGLRKLTPGLVNDRIESAHGRGLLTDDERERCLSRNVSAIKNQEGREDQVCLVIGRGIFDHEIGGGLHPFLGGWGGEAMNGWPGPDSDPLLRRLGRPAIVVSALDIAVVGSEAYLAPGLAKLFVGKKLGLADAFGEIYVREDIPGAHILDIWQPGHFEYDLHRDLPRS
jgi:hypothetical protein